MQAQHFIDFNPGKAAPLFLLGEHAGFALPRALARLGVDEQVFRTDPNFAGDHGVRRILFRLARELSLPGAAGRYSRLLVDLNRDPGHAQLFWTKQHGVDVPANITLTDDEKAQRIAAFYNPFHTHVDARLAALTQGGVKPFLFTIHSYTPSVARAASLDAARYQDVDIGILYMDDHPFVKAFGAFMEKEGLNVGYNQPYDLKALRSGSLIRHQNTHGLSGAAIEINVGLLKSVADQDVWADRLTRFLKTYLAAT